MMRKICFVLASLALAVYAEEAAEPKAVKPEATEPKDAPAPMLKARCKSECLDGFACVWDRGRPAR